MPFTGGTTLLPLALLPPGQIVIMMIVMIIILIKVRSFNSYLSTRPGPHPVLTSSLTRPLAHRLQVMRT